MVAYGINSLLQRKAATAEAGFALQNATPTILTWTAPDDGQQHQVIVCGMANIAANATGGEITIAWTPPAGGAQSYTAVSDSHAAGVVGFGISSPDTEIGLIVKAGTTVTLAQATALTAGGPSTVYAEIWGA